MKIGTIIGVLAAAAAVAAIAVAAPSRAAERPAAAPAERGSEPAWEVPAWMLVVSGLVGLGVMFRAARPAFRD